MRLGRVSLIALVGSIGAVLVVVAVLATPNESAQPEEELGLARAPSAPTPASTAERVTPLGGFQLVENDDGTFHLEHGLLGPEVLHGIETGLVAIAHQLEGNIESATFDLAQRSWSEPRVVARGRPENERILAARPIDEDHYELFLLHEPFDGPHQATLLRTDDGSTSELPPELARPRTVGTTEQGFQVLVQDADELSVWWVGMDLEPRSVELPPTSGSAGLFSAIGVDGETAITVEGGCVTVGCEATLTRTLLDEGLSSQVQDRWAAGLYHGVRWPADLLALWPMGDEALVVFSTLDDDMERGHALVRFGLGFDEISAVPLPIPDHGGPGTYFRFQRCAESLWLLGLVHTRGDVHPRIEAVRVQPEVAQRAYLLHEEQNLTWNDVAVGCLGERLAVAGSTTLSLTP